MSSFSLNTKSYFEVHYASDLEQKHGPERCLHTWGWNVDVDADGVLMLVQ